MKTCSIDDCTAPHRARGWCDNHLQQWYRTGDPGTKLYKPAKLCDIEGCDRKDKYFGLCSMHHRRLQVNGNPLKIQKAAPGQSPGWTTNKGYRLVFNPDHPLAYKSGYVLEHKAVMCEMIGRMLLPGENVHHKNGVRDDNRPGNLELWVVSQPSGQRPADLVQWAREILDRYVDDVDKGVV